MKNFIKKDEPFICEKCGTIHKNIIATDDDINKIIEITKKD